MFLYKHFVGGPNTREIDDIGRNLGFLFAAKRGCGYFLESFGLTDTGFRTTGEMMTMLAREIEENIRLYEPRVELLKIDERYADGRPRLIVNLRVREGQEKLKLTVNLADRTFDIQPVEAKQQK
jgi:predicted component of type VI protein secretion system